MKKMILKKILIIGIAALAVVGCGNSPEPTPTVDPVVVMTDVAGTIQAEVTRNAMLTPSATIPPPATPTIPSAPTLVLPFETPTPAGPVGDMPDNATYVADVTVPDGTVFWQRERFTKTWQIENTGKTTWTTNYRFVYLDGPITSEEIVFNLVKPVAPGQLLNISVVMTAPDTLGTYTNYWQMMNADGQFFGDVVSMKIVVGTELDKTATPSG